MPHTHFTGLRLYFAYFFVLMQLGVWCSVHVCCVVKLYEQICNNNDDAVKGDGVGG